MNILSGRSVLRPFFFRLVFMSVEAPIVYNLCRIVGLLHGSVVSS
jgi:hypothetical protein